MNKFVEIEASKGSISKRKLVFGIGINDSPYKIENRFGNKRVQCPYYKKWMGMLTRAYDPKYHAKNPTYRDVTVCDEWLVFSNFKAWMSTQENNHLQLDKDLLIKGNKIYGSDTCMFVSQLLNTLFIAQESHRGEYKIGASWNKQHKKFHSKIKIYGKQRHLGYFDTEEESHQCYLVAKSGYVQEIIATNPFKDSHKAIEAIKQILKGN